MTQITNNLFYIGVNDHKTDLFEGQFAIPNGISYNSYLLIDDKITIFDSVDIKFYEEWLVNIKEILKDKNPDYLIIHHMEPDHSGSLEKFLNKYPNTTIVASAMAFKMFSQFFPNVTIQNKIIVKDNDNLKLGSHNLKFYSAPNVHWPEVMFSYEEKTKTLFSADAFGKFGALDYFDEEGWACEARRYYFGIVGKYGNNVANVLKKLSDIDIKRICSLHGPILDDNINYYLSTYETWSKYEPETNGVAIFYSSVYGNTKKACEILKDELVKKQIKVALNDLSREDIYECVEDAFRYSKIVLASITYNGSCFSQMDYFINLLKERNFQNKEVAFIENGTWAPSANKAMKEKLSTCANLNFVDKEIKILSTLNETNLNEIKMLADLLTK